ncbi:MAG: HEAT repeat domain-containing protein [Sedimentisphaerales bacterium]|jgi:HEAT repeat protein|nr:HEAT repeat domain-containing protein [Sedimentisphaerales bacterium]
MKDAKVWWVLGLVAIVLSAGIVHVGNAGELSFLEENPELKARLLQWEREAPEDVKEEINIIRTGDAESRTEAAIRLAEKGERAKGAILALLETLRDRTSFVPVSGRSTSPAEEVTKALGRIGKVAGEELIQALKDQDWHVRWAAALAVGQIRDKRAVGALIQSLKDWQWRVRRVAMEALETIDPGWRQTDAAKNAVPAFIRALKDEDEYVRELGA